MLNLIFMLNKVLILMKKIQNLKQLIMSEYQNTKAFLIKDILQIGHKKLLLLTKLKIHFHGLMLLVISMVKKLLEHFMKRNCRRQIKKKLEQKKQVKEKEKNYKYKNYIKRKRTINGKVLIILLIVGLIKKTLNENPLYKNESILS